MLDKIQLGDTIHVKIVKQPTNAAASKTLARVLCKDPGHHAELERHREIRRTNTAKTTRGGRYRIWESRMVKQHPVTGKQGETGTIKATYDVMQDLRSVERFIEVAKQG